MLPYSLIDDLYGLDVQVAEAPIEWSHMLQPFSGAPAALELVPIGQISPQIKASSASIINRTRSEQSIHLEGKQRCLIIRLSASTGRAGHGVPAAAL